MLPLLKGKFDIHIDSNHRWDDDRMLELDASVKCWTHGGLHGSSDDHAEHIVLRVWSARFRY